MISFLETDEIKKLAYEMASEMKASGSYSFPSKPEYPLSDLKKNTMFGIMKCGNRILRAFSGAIASRYIIPGYIPPCFSVNAFCTEAEKDDALIHELTQRINNGESELTERRAEITTQKLDRIRALYSFSSWNGEKLALPVKAPTGTGDCAGLKLINKALRDHLEIKGLAEFMMNEDGSLTFFPPCESRCGLLLPSMLGLDFIYADGDIAVIDKKEGMLSVPGKGEDKLDSASYRFHKLFPSSPEQCAAHRLDMDTSGLLVLAFTTEMKARMNISFENRIVKKEYEALLEGVLEEDHGIIDIPIRLDTDNRPRQIADHVNGKKAVTVWKRLGVEVIDGIKYTRVRFFPETGRTHQLRVHSASIGHPIKGDRLYGTRKEGERLALHASSITFPHPRTGETVTFTSTCPF